MTATPRVGRGSGLRGVAKTPDQAGQFARTGMAISAKYALYDRILRDVRYPPSFLLKGVRLRDGLTYAREILDRSKTTSGFSRLLAARRPDLTIEALALSPEFRELFSADELATAESRVGHLLQDR